MIPRLLKQSDIDSLKSIDRRREIEEGKKLANRVDSLREIVANEELALEKFRSKTIEVLHEDITMENKKRDELKAEVDNLLQLRGELLKPLDDEWEATRRQNYLLGKESDIISGIKKDLESREKRIVALENDIRIKTTKIGSMENLSYRRLKEAESKDNSSQIALTEAKRIRDESLSQKEETHREILHRDNLVSEREKEITIREQSLAIKERKNEEEIIRLNDQRQTLERAFKRLNIPT